MYAQIAVFAVMIIYVVRRHIVRSNRVSTSDTTGMIFEQNSHRRRRRRRHRCRHRSKRRCHHHHHRRRAAVTAAAAVNARAVGDEHGRAFGGPDHFGLLRTRGHVRQDQVLTGVLMDVMCCLFAVKS